MISLLLEKGADINMKDEVRAFLSLTLSVSLSSLICGLLFSVRQHSPSQCEFHLSHLSRSLSSIDEGFAKNILQPTPQFLQAKKRMAKRRSKTVPQPKQEDGPSHVSESEGAKGGKKAKAKVKDGEDMASLRNAILKRHSNPFENILSKYSEPGSSREDYEVDEEDFMRTQEKMMKKKGGGERDTMVGSRAKPKKTEESKESVSKKRKK
jgi:alanyl-tRNA synthetase